MIITKIIRRFLKLTKSDFIFLLIPVIVLCSFYFFFYRKSEYINIKIKVTDQDVLYQSTEPKSWYANQFEVGDKEYDALGRVVTEIVSVDSFNIDSIHKAVYLNLKVKAVFDTRSKLYSARGKTLIFGAPMRFNLSKITFDGFVTQFPGSDLVNSTSTEYMTVHAIGRNVEPLIASVVQKGDKIFDSNNNLLAEVNNVEVKPAEQVTQTDSGDLYLRYNPLYKDIILTINVRTKKLHNEIFMFDNLPFKIGETIPLNFNKISIFPMITNIIED